MEIQLVRLSVRRPKRRRSVREQKTPKTEASHSTCFELLLESCCGRYAIQHLGWLTRSAASHIQTTVRPCILFPGLATTRHQVAHCLASSMHFPWLDELSKRAAETLCTIAVPVQSARTT